MGLLWDDAPTVTGRSSSAQNPHGRQRHARNASAMTTAKRRRPSIPTALAIWAIPTAFDISRAEMPIRRNKTTLIRIRLS